VATSDKDWQRARELHPILVQRFLTRFFDEVDSITNGRGTDLRGPYRDLFRLISERDKLIPELFEGMTHSNMWVRVLAWKRHGLLTKDEERTFTFEIQEALRQVSVDRR